MPFMATKENGKKELQVRATLAFIFTIGATAGFFMKLITPESYMTLVTMAVSFYFAKRGEKDDTKSTPTV
jgi:hypothetical protein